MALPEDNIDNPTTTISSSPHSISSGATIAFDPCEDDKIHKALKGIFFNPHNPQSILSPSPVVHLNCLKGNTPEGTFGYRTVVAEFEQDKSLHQVVWRCDGSSNTKAGKSPSPRKACVLVQCY
jgi:hypothetical protein